MQTDVRSVRLAASGAALDTRSRVKGIYVVHAASPGTVQLRDGGASGPIQVELDFPTSNTSPVWVDFPGEGVLFETDVYVTFGANITAVSIFYG